MHSVQSGYSLTLEVHGSHLSSLENWLSEIGKDPENNPEIPFGKSVTTLYCSIVTVPEQKNASGSETLPAMLMFLTSISGPLNNHLEELVKIAAPGLRKLLGHCKDVEPNQFCF